MHVNVYCMFIHFTQKFRPCTFYGQIHMFYFHIKIHMLKLLKTVICMAVKILVVLNSFMAKRFPKYPFRLKCIISKILYLLKLVKYFDKVKVIQI